MVEKGEKRGKRGKEREQKEVQARMVEKGERFFICGFLKEGKPVHRFVFSFFLVLKSPRPA